MDTVTMEHDRDHMSGRAIVVGGGIGGASAALLLARVGLNVVLLERADAPSPSAGTAIGLYPNGLAVLYGLGLRDRLHQRAHLVRSASVFLADQLLLEEPVPFFSPELDHMLVLHRAWLAEVLHQAVAEEPRIDMRFGATVTEACSASEGAVEVTYGQANGSASRPRPLRAELIVGADGVGSRVRQGGNFGGRTRRLRSISLRLILPGRVWGESVREYWTRWGLCLGAPIDAESTYLAVSAARGPLAAALASNDIPKVRRLVTTMAPSAESLDQVPDDAFVIRWVDEVRTRRWAHGRAALLGDAAHAMSPHLGQGANSALLDGLALAESLRGHSPGPNQFDRIDTALNDYNARRIKAVHRIQRAAVAYQFISENATPPGVRQIRDHAMRTAMRLVRNPDSHLQHMLQRDPAEALAATRHLASPA